MHTEPAVFQLTAKVSRQPFRLTQQSLQNNRQALLRTSRVGGANNRCNSTLTSLGTVQRSKSNATCFPIVRLGNLRGYPFVWNIGVWEKTAEAATAGHAAAAGSKPAPRQTMTSTLTSDAVSLH